MTETKLAELLRMLITANHILHYHSVVDAYGHISVRHPSNPETFVMSGYLAPALVESPSNLIEYHIRDASPVDPQAAPGYSERFIHSEILKRFPAVNCVLHSHAEAVLPYAVTGVPMLPVFHMAGFLGQRVPTFDIEPLYEPGEDQDMLVKNARFGSALAAEFSAVQGQPSTEPASPDYNVVLMRKHGFTTVGPDIETAVYRAIYTQTNARLLTESIALQNAYWGDSGGVSSDWAVKGLTLEQTLGSAKMNEQTQDRPWKLWTREVEASPLYVNKA